MVAGSLQVVMKVIAIEDVEARELDAEVFVSTAIHRDILNETESGINISLSEVSFRPGERTKYHTHPNGQILYVTSGQGYAGTKDERDVIEEGDAVFFPGGENHWHGATESTPMTHLSFIPFTGDSGSDSIGDSPEY